MKNTTREPHIPVPSTRYDQDPAHRLRSRHLDDAVYAQVLDSMIIVCTDAIIVTPDRPGLVWLARRNVRPMRGWWIIGGRRRTSETIGASMARNFGRETTLDLPEDRFRLVRLNEYTWTDREQEPQDGGSHNLCHTFVVELNETERRQAAANLERAEYVAGVGLKAFDLARLQADPDIHPMLIDLHHDLFPDW